MSGSSRRQQLLRCTQLRLAPPNEPAPAQAAQFRCIHVPGGCLGARKPASTKGRVSLYRSDSSAWIRTRDLTIMSRAPPCEGRAQADSEVEQGGVGPTCTRNPSVPPQRRSDRSSSLWGSELDRERSGPAYRRPLLAPLVLAGRPGRCSFAWKARAEPSADTGCRSSHKTGGGPGRSAGGPECSPASAPQRGTQVCRGDLRVLKAPLLEHRMRTVPGGLAPRLTRGDDD
jgi:hypothetical protein